MGSPRGGSGRRRLGARRSVVVVVALLVGGGLGLSAALHHVVSMVEARRHPAPGRTIDLGTHTMHYVARGERGPVIVFESGLPGTHVDWTSIQTALEPHARSIAVDRAGYGWSSPGPLPRSSEQIARELHTVLDLAGLPAPYVLVGHSFGGVVMRAFAVNHANDVAALVLVDATHESYREVLPASYLAHDRATAARLRWGAMLAPLGLQRVLGIGLLPQGDATDPIRYRTDAYRTASHEFAAMDESVAAVAGRTLGDLPVRVVARGRPHPPIAGMTPEEMVALDEAWRALQVDLLGLSSRSTINVVEDAGHFVHLDRPDLLVEVILELIQGSDAPGH